FSIRPSMSPYMARIATHLLARLVQTLPLVEHSDLFRFPRQYAGGAPETARLLAAAELEQRSLYRASFENCRLHRCALVHLRIPGRGLYSSLPHHSLSGLDQRVEFSGRRSFCLC